MSVREKTAERLCEKSFGKSRKRLDISGKLYYNGGNGGKRRKLTFREGFFMKLATSLADFGRYVDGGLYRYV